MNPYQPEPITGFDAVKASEPFVDHIGSTFDLVEGGKPIGHVSLMNLIQSILEHGWLQPPLDGFKQFHNGNVSLDITYGVKMELQGKANGDVFTYTFCKIIFDGVFFKGFFSEDLPRIKAIYNMVWQHLYDYNLCIWNWDEFINKVSFYRLDLSRNWHAELDLEKLWIKTDSRNHKDIYRPSDRVDTKMSKIFGRSWNKTEYPCETLVIDGKQKDSKDRIRMIIYDKRKDPNKRHDLDRFLTDKFYRQNIILESVKLKMLV